MADDWSSRIPDHVHQLDLCPTCEGLRVTRMDRLPGLVDVKLDGDTGFSFTGRAVVRIGRLEECPNPPAREEVTGHG